MRPMMLARLSASHWGFRIVPSLSARILTFVLKTTKIALKQFSGGPGMMKVIAAARAAPLPVPTAKMHRRLDVRVEQFEGRSVWHIAPKDSPPRGNLLYFHGGGYVFSAAPPHWSSLAELVEKHGIAVTAPLYPLAPESCAEDVTDWALDYYSHYIAGHAGPFVMGGDSAGGGLTAATTMAARDAGLRLPDGLLLICPWLDASGSHPDQPAIEPRDCILRIQGIRDAGALYARDLPIDDPRVSPIHGRWADLPPVMMFGGGNDILVTDARTLKTKLPSAEYEEKAGLMHIWPLLPISEARAARDTIGRWIAAQ
ncbi:MAG: alpha/beta hydrolase fold domain-containing protein [Pseudomonadota bacterium]